MSPCLRASSIPTTMVVTAPRPKRSATELHSTRPVLTQQQGWKQPGASTPAVRGWRACEL